VARSYRSPSTEVRLSSIHGRGLFCLAPICAGEVIGVRSGDVVDYAEAIRRDRLFGGFSMQVTEDLFLCPESAETVDDVALFINHSCKPNVWLQDQIVFAAIRDIAPNEELLFDYAMNLSTPYSRSCQCGTGCCRGRITGDDWKREDLQERYRGHFDPVITRKMLDAQNQH
jgi:SET domain-containing protein